MSCGLGRRHGSDPTWLWLWCRPAAVAPIGPLGWEPPYAAGVAQEVAKKKKQKNKKLNKRVAVERLPSCQMGLWICYPENAGVGRDWSRHLTCALSLSESRSGPFSGNQHRLEGFGR